MATTLVLTCPECKTKIRVPEAAIGKKIRCKACEHVFPVKAPAKSAEAVQEKKGPPPAASKPAPQSQKPQPAVMKYADDEDDDGKSYGLTTDDLGHRCPQCAEEMESPEAVVCLNCGFNTQTRSNLKRRKIKDVTPQDRFQWKLPGILSAVGAVLLIGYWFFHHFALPDMCWDGFSEVAEEVGRADLVKHEAAPWTAYLFHPGIELWILIMIVFADYYLGKIAVYRLITHPDPPEVEVN